MKKTMMLLLYVLLPLSSYIIFPNEILWFPVTHHIIAEDNGTTHQYPDEISLVMQELNKAFLPAGIQFYMSCVGGHIRQTF